MADADRLRAAADRLDEWTVLGRDELTANGSATAALLRAVASHPRWVDDDERCTGCYAVVVGDYAARHYRNCEWGAALALADAILGDDQ